MKEIVSKSVSPKWLKRRKKDEAKLTQYWSNMYPIDYTKDMTRDYQKEAISRFDVGLKKLASDAVDVVFNAELKQTRDGFVFVDIPNCVFEGLLPLLGSGVEIPPKNKKHSDDIGAHITVIKKKEIQNNKIEFKNNGDIIRYKMKGVQKVDNPEGWDEIESVWFITVDSPDLSRIRVEHGLSPTISDHDFHITLGVRKRQQKEEENA